MKPFSMRELLARVRALLRRNEQATSVPEAARGSDRAHYDRFPPTHRDED